ncbi:DUF4381 domain-containing protein [Accumulibacter sp.]|uniref:DUF4381 domain-containing protein n=1 Tax=Accumulibacter sp. TaxID=2053492 RepID=UPI0025DFAADE|nr:DUF4381 domain-containing protein [Accumulibacter sp.]MCP5227526.1 DUF4381 domain-containing protein [Accumulibacter sp.]
MSGAGAEWLTQLAPAHAPPAAGWWPLAPGWWGVVALLLIGVAGMAYWRTRPAVRLRRVALRELERLEALACDDRALASGIEDLLRRYALARFGRAAVAGLSGERWISFVVAHGGRAWAGTAGSGLLRAAYGSTVEADRGAWLSGARAFLKARR